MKSGRLLTFTVFTIGLIFSVHFLFLALEVEVLVYEGTESEVGSIGENNMFGFVYIMSGILSLVKTCFYMVRA